MSVRDRMMQDLELAGYADATRSAYLNAIGDFAKYHWRDPAGMGQEEVRSWVEHLSKPPGLSVARLGQHFAALRFFYARFACRNTASSSRPSTRPV